MRRAALLLALLAPLLTAGNVGYVPERGTSNQYGISLSGTGNETTLQALQALTKINADNLRTVQWSDPFGGNDTTGDGTYATPWRSLRILKQNCLNHPWSLCKVKGRNRAFSPRTLTLTFTTPGIFATDEPVTWTHADGGNGAGNVVAAEGDNLVVITTTAATNVWGTTPTAPEPRTDTVITGGWGGAVAAVTAFEDTIVGLHSTLFAAADINTGTDVVTVNSHGYSSQTGPFLWMNETTMPTAAGLVEDNSSILYVCNVTADTFQVSVSSTCASTLNFTAAGTGSNQLIPYYTHSTVTGFPEVSATGWVTPPCAGDRHEICTMLDSEYPDSPAIIDGGGFYIAEIRALIAPERWPTLASGGVYNPPIGYLFGVSHSPADFSQGWSFFVNVVVQNIAMDAYAAYDGGKAAWINAGCKAIRNGYTDRSQTGVANPSYQAHNSCVQVSGTPAVAGEVAAVGWWINTGDAWNYQGSNAGSGGAINANSGGVLNIVSNGRIWSDVHASDTGCVGTPCSSSLIVTPSGEFNAIGPELAMGGAVAAERQRFHGSGMPDASHYVRVLFNLRGAFSPDAYANSDFILFNPTLAGAHEVNKFDEVTFRAAGYATLATICEIDPGGDGTASRVITGHNILVESVDSGTAKAIISDCGATGSVDDMIRRTTLNLEGIIDHEDGGVADKYFWGPTSSGRNVGACGTTNTWRDDICDSLVAGSLPETQWRWFSDNSSESGGASNGDQFGGDASYRCDVDEDCFVAASGGDYTVTLRSQLYVEPETDDTCLPAEVLGRKVCELVLTPRNVGAR